MTEETVEGVRNAEDGKPARADPNRGDPGKILVCGMETRASAVVD